LIAELPRMPMGDTGSAEFERWVFRSVKILFAGKLTNPQLKPNGDAIQRRDVVATVMAEAGFWKRVRDDYETRQVLFEVKNYVELKPDDFRQVLSYSGNDYGRLGIIVNRSETEGLGERERGWVREMWNLHKRVILVITAATLARCIRKMRNSQRYDYVENTLTKLLDTYVRSYFSSRAGRGGS
ncbi:MAG TPA: ATP-binding protein, partial [Candidatus Binatia bacterium]|nr:ATP-binding protein [Candidatus Binatia bacterium]